MATTITVKLYLNHTFSDILQLFSKSYGISTISTFCRTNVTVDGRIVIEADRFYNCSCITNPDTCSTNAAFYNYTISNNSLKLLHEIMGIRLTFSPSRSTLLSNLACWYSEERYDQVIEVRWPTETIVQQLFDDYSTSLRCPCTEDPFQLESFVNLSVRLHEIYSNPFIEGTWITSIFDDGNWSDVPENQFRIRGVLQTGRVPGTEPNRDLGSGKICRVGSGSGYN
ncbi:unnamed protein product [Adineta ricciae]|uniref:Uncharacterized protein n=1 Tax=Adineta ricciae TaxID=249248 RepID=A0A814Z320_ADIRI|nr:unnamed protein product [Adineta ricciae]